MPRRMKKRKYYLEEASIRGHPDARYQLALHEWRNGRNDRAVKHWIIAANLGYDDAIQVLTKCYQAGSVSFFDFAAALLAHKAALDATKSRQREEGEKHNFT